MWGTWWEWGDPRLTSELIMFFLYIGFIALHSSVDDLKKADKAGAILILVGAITVPIIHFSVEWWSSLHQGPTLFRADGPSIDPSMLYPLVLMILGFCFYFCALILIRIRGEILYRQQNTNWVRNLIARENYE
jgi:heme exporter protein C